MQRPEDFGRSSLVETEPRVHGGLHDAELDQLGLGADDVLDFSSSTNPYGPAPAMLRALQEGEIQRVGSSKVRKSNGETARFTSGRRLRKREPLPTQIALLAVRESS